MPNLLANNFRFRRTFAKTLPAIEVHNLISIQRESYEKFLQTGVAAPERDNTGLQAVFKSVFPIQDFSNRASLQFVGYDLEIPKYDVDECRERGMTFSAPLKVTVRLVVWDVDSETETRTVQVPKVVMEDREIEVPRQVYETVTRTVQRPKTVMEDKVVTVQEAKMVMVQKPQTVSSVQYMQAPMYSYGTMPGAPAPVADTSAQV